MIPRCDTTDAILVLGGGPAGSACARELALRGHAVLLIPGSSKSSCDFGETAGAGFVRFLASHGLSFPDTAGSRLTRFGSSWGGDELEYNFGHFLGLDAAQALNRADLDRWMVQEASLAGVAVLPGAVARSAAHDGTGWRLKVRDDHSECLVTGRFVVEATGRGARSVCHADVGRHYTDQLACICMSSAPTSRTEALVEATTDGWWYALADVGACSFVAYFTDADHIPATVARRGWLEARFRATRHIQEMVGALPPWDSVRVRDARTSVRTVLLRNGCLAIGDAAWTLDPLSGFGVERATKCGIAASRAIADAIETGVTDPLLDFAREQVNTFIGALGQQRRVYSGEHRFDSAFWTRRQAVLL